MSARTRILTAITSRLRQALPDTEVDPGLPGKVIHRRHIYVPLITGERQFAFIQAGPHTVDDQFTITFIFQVADKALSSLEAGEQVEEMSDALLDIFHTDPGLDTELPEIIDIQPGRFEGPELSATDEGVIAFIRADVNVHCRYES